MFFLVFQCLIISFFLKVIIKAPMVPFNQYQQRIRWESLLPINNLVFTIIIIIVICNMLIVSSIDAYYFFVFYSLFFPFLHHQTFGPFSFFVSPNFWVLFFLQICGGFTPSTWVSTTALSYFFSFIE